MSQLIAQRDKLLAASAEAQRAGKLDVAENLCRQALSMDSSSIAGKFILGSLLARKGESAQAIPLLTAVAGAEPRSYQVLVSLSSLHLEAGNLSEAAALARRVVDLQPLEAQAHNHLGRVLLADRQLEEAANAFRQAIELQPSYAAAYHNLGVTVQLEGKDGEAARAFMRAAQLSPTLSNLIPFGQTLLTLCDFENAEACARHCLSLYPESASANLLLCGALIGLGQLNEADRFLQEGIERDKDGSEALQIAERQRPLGYIELANDNLRRAIRRNPRHVSAYDSLMHNQKVSEEDRPLVESLQHLLADKSLSATELTAVHYGLGKAFEDLGEFERSMVHYDEANRFTRKVKIGDIKFDEDQYRRQIDRQIEAFSILPSENRAASSSEMSVAIIGMMRSGTTLAEQILSSHPKVVPAGELLYWSQNWSRVFSQGALSIHELGREYLDLLSKIGKGAERVTDKMPGNYHFAGLIHRAFPNARIIHMRRSPADTCLSIWATPNHMPTEGGHEKAATVFVYKEYLRMMDYWRQMLPSACLLEVDYESLVSNREEVTRQIIAFCGLEWDDACLHPEKNDRMVTTPSLWQVRQPVYKTSVQRWKKFEPWLGEFRELLDLKSAGA